DIAIAGGAAGGGKTWGLLLEPIRHVSVQHFGAVIFRREMPRITQEGGMWDESLTLYPYLGGVPRMSPTHEWRFPSGATITFAHLQHETDKLNWAGAQIPLLLFDQLEEFTEGQFWYLLSRNRSTVGIRPYLRATCNPVPEDDPVGGWLHRLLQWWIDPVTGYAIAARSGALRWFSRVGDELVWGDSRAGLLAELLARGVPAEDADPLSLTFIPMDLESNRALLAKDPGYRAKLLALPLVERERLLRGNWNVKPTAGKVLNRAWFRILRDAPAPTDDRGRARIVARVRYWDKAGSVAKPGTDPDWTAGVRIARLADGPFLIESVVRGRWTHGDRERVIVQTAQTDPPGTAIWVEQEPGSGGKESAELTIQRLAGYTVRADKVTGAAVARVGPLASQAEAGNVWLLGADWNEPFLVECHAFPDGAHD